LYSRTFGLLVAKAYNEKGINDMKITTLKLMNRITELPKQIIFSDNVDPLISANPMTWVSRTPLSVFQWMGKDKEETTTDMRINFGGPVMPRFEDATYGPVVNRLQSVIDVKYLYAIHMAEWRVSRSEGRDLVHHTDRGTIANFDTFRKEFGQKLLNCQSDDSAMSL